MALRFGCRFVILCVLTACSAPSAGSGTGATDAAGDAWGPVADSQVVDIADGVASDATVADTLAPDGALVDQSAAADAPGADADWGELLDPIQDTSDVLAPDVAAPPAGAVGNLYAHTSDTLYRLDLKAGAFVKVGYFSFDKNPGSVTDIALDSSGKLFAVTFDDVFECSVNKASCAWLSSLPNSFNGLTFVAKGVVDPNGESLIGISTSGSWNQIIVTGKTAKIVYLGQYGGGWSSSGDSFSVDGIGTYATVKGMSSSDSLVQVDPKNGKVLKVIGATGVSELYGLAWWNGVFYGFSADGNAYTLDVATGKAKVVAGIKVPSGVAWWGAGVSTRAAGTPNP